MSAMGFSGGLHIANFLRRLIRRGKRPVKPYRYLPEHETIADYAEFAGLPITEIEHRINAFKRLCREDWERCPGSTFEQRALQFYSSSENYIYDLLSQNPSQEFVLRKLDQFTEGRLVRAFRDHPGRRFLEFGGGTGVFCEIMSAMGKDVVYLDIPGRPFEFAVWRFRKRHLPIQTMVSCPEQVKLDSSFDIIFTDAVIEHLPVTGQSNAVATLCQAVAPGGLLALIVDLAGESDDYPMHVGVDIGLLHDLASQHQMEALWGRGTFCSLWRRCIASSVQQMERPGDLSKRCARSSR